MSKQDSKGKEWWEHFLDHIKGKWVALYIYKLMNKRNFGQERILTYKLPEHKSAKRQLIRIEYKQVKDFEFDSNFEIDGWHEIIFEDDTRIVVEHTSFELYNKKPIVNP